MKVVSRPPSLLIAAMLLGLVAVPSQAQSPVKPVESRTTAIATKTSQSSDAEITTRVRSIFSQIAALRAVTVRVSAGVVTLGGSVPAAVDIDRAEAIAGRVSGVVTVENNIARDLAIDSNLAPVLGNFGKDVRGIVNALPLLGVAVILAGLIALLGYIVAGRERIWRAITPNAFLADLVATSIRVAFVLAGIVAALEILDATALLGAVLGGAGVIGIALGFAVRDTIDNYVSSLMLSLRQPFRANDHVVIEGNEGRVVRLTSRATILMTLDGNHLRIPNSTVFKAVILNYTRNPQRRFAFDLGIDADDDPIDGMAVGLAAINASPVVLDTPKASAIIQDVGDSNIVLRFYGWVDQTRTDFMKGRSLAIQAAKSALEAAGYVLPEPIYRLRFDQGAPLPLANVRSPRPAPDESRPRRTTETTIEDATAPENHVELMVRNERSEGPSDDLLDDSRPVE